MKKTKKTPPQVEETTYIRIIDHVEYEVTREADPDNRWSGEDTDESHDIEGFEVVTERQRWDFVVKGTPRSCYYLVVVFYSTGDSFSHHSGKVSFVALRDTVEDANKIAKAIGSRDDRSKHGDYDRSYDVRLSFREQFHVDASPWTGYFESIENIQVLELHERLH